MAVLAAVARREQTGHGDHIDIGMFDVQVSMLANRRSTRPFGLAGGGEGAAGITRLWPAGARQAVEWPACASFAVEAGDVGLRQAGRQSARRNNGRRRLRPRPSCKPQANCGGDN